MAGRKNEPIKFRLFYDGKQVDRLPEGYSEKVCERLSETLSAYFTQHPEKFDAFLACDCVERIPLASKDACG